MTTNSFGPLFESTDEKPQVRTITLLWHDPEGQLCSSTKVPVVEWTKSRTNDNAYDLAFVINTDGARASDVFKGFII